MSRRVLFVALIVATLLLGLAGQAFASGDEELGGKVRLICQLEGGYVNAAAEQAIENAGGKITRVLPIIGGALIYLPEQAVANGLPQFSGITSMQRDTRVYATKKPTNPGKPEKEQPPQELPTGVDRIDADLNTNEGLGVKVAIIDSGIDYRHPDLQNNFDSKLLGIDYVNNDNDPMDDNGHGTHVAGIIAAEENNIGVVGVAPKATLYAVKVLDRRGNGYLSDVIAGINWVTTNGIDVANMSLGAPAWADLGGYLHLAIQNAVNAGVTIVVAAGNDDDNASDYIPAGYEEVITVSAIADFDGASGGLAESRAYGKGRNKVIQADDTLAWFSNWGSVIDIAAPGVDITSTLKGGEYGTKSGTSMACPHVAGSVALYIATYRIENGASPTPAQVKEALVALAEPQVDDPLTEEVEGFGGDDDSCYEPLVNAEAL